MDFPVGGTGQYVGPFIPDRLPAPLRAVVGRSTYCLVLCVLSELPRPQGFGCGHSSTVLSRVLENLAQHWCRTWASGNRFPMGQSFRNPS